MMRVGESWLYHSIFFLFSVFCQTHARSLGYLIRTLRLLGWMDDRWMIEMVHSKEEVGGRLDLIYSRNVFIYF